MDAHEHFDAVVIGAGPAGSMAALTLSHRGVRVLLVDKSQLGRRKVCGCCLGLTGQAVLVQAGLERVVQQATPLERCRLASRHHVAAVPLRGFVSVARETLDPALIEAAVDGGVQARFGLSARATADGVVSLSNGSSIQAGVVIDASGLRGHRHDDARVPRKARIGLGLTTDGSTCRPGELTMAVARGGYLGRVGLADGRIDFAAAVEPAWLRKHASPTQAMQAIWAEAGLDSRDVPDGSWRGTPALTRSKDAQQGRILRVGDAAGYVEPFTGEGMSWALLAGRHVADDAVACIRDGPEASRWQRTMRALLGRRHARCRIVSRAVRSPRLVGLAIAAANATPELGAASAAAFSGSRRSVA